MDDAAQPAERGPGAGHSGLTDRDVRLLAFERQWWRHAGAKEQAIREEFGLSSARYYQLLGALLDSPAALAHDPMLVKRLQRVRAARTAARAERVHLVRDSQRARPGTTD
ncbi:DUF3263 domain-containing protein [Planctomonas psychrotolerans]|uniref:DUF3263 domain-containing protein n=1 Tax=Planctomonas psychrotolerans TaxID=2528712 RepID=UPI00123AAF17|nr:DUF3263 domain-containing protein [Planctomonas psychrotolerans]